MKEIIKQLLTGKKYIFISAAVALILFLNVGISFYYHAALKNAEAQFAREQQAMADAALEAERQANAARDAAARKVESLDAMINEERQKNETDNRRYRAALAAGTERLRVPVTVCAAGRDSVSGPARSTRVGNDAAPYADLDRAAAQRIFAVARDDQREIDKLKALQAYVCAVRPETAECEIAAAH